MPVTCHGKDWQTCWIIGNGSPDPAAWSEDANYPTGRKIHLLAPSGLPEQLDKDLPMAFEFRTFFPDNEWKTAAQIWPPLLPRNLHLPGFL